MKKAYRPTSLEEVCSLKGDRLYGLLNVRVYGKVLERKLCEEILTLSSIAEETHSKIKVDFKLILKENVAKYLTVGSVVQILGEVHCLNDGVVVVAHLVRDFSGVRPTLYQKYVSQYPLEKSDVLVKETQKTLNEAANLSSEALFEDLETQFLKYHSTKETNS